MCDKWWFDGLEPYVGIIVNDKAVENVECLICPAESITCPSESTPKLEPKQVIFNYPATVVYWNDGTKTVVKCDRPKNKKQKNWKEQGFLNAYVKKCDPHYVDMLTKWVEDYQ